MNEDAIEQLAYQLVQQRSDMHDALIQMRKNKELSLEEVAERMAVSVEDVANFERYDGMDTAKMGFVNRYALAVGALIEHRVTDTEKSTTDHCDNCGVKLTYGLCWWCDGEPLTQTVV